MNRRAEKKRKKKQKSWQWTQRIKLHSGPRRIRSGMKLQLLSLVVCVYFTVPAGDSPMENGGRSPKET